MQAYYERDGLRLNYYADDFTDPWANAQTIVLIHAAMCNAQRFAPWVPALSRDYRVVRPDLRGYGNSDMPPADQPVSLDVLVEDMIALLDTLGVEKAHIVGNSSGGFIGQRLAMRYPDRVHTLAVYSSGPGLKKTNAASWIPRIQSTGLRQFLADTIEDRFPPEFIGTPQVEAFLDDLGRCDIPYIGRYVGHMASQEWSGEMHRILCPTLVVAPGAGSIHSLAEYQPMKEHLPRGEMIVYDGALHSVCEYMADQCIADLRSFLKRHPVDPE